MVLVDPENTSLIRKQSIALTVGHEIAHQWFGNLGNLTAFCLALNDFHFVIYSYFAFF